MRSLVGACGEPHAKPSALEPPCPAAGIAREPFGYPRAMPSNLDAIASRSLELRHADGTTSPVVVRIGRPRRDAMEYRCDYEIEGLSKVRTLHIRGIDDVQALWLALVDAGVELRSSDKGKAGRIAFVGDADLGFPGAEQLTEPEWHPRGRDRRSSSPSAASGAGRVAARSGSVEPPCPWSTSLRPSHGRWLC